MRHARARTHDRSSARGLGAVLLTAGLLLSGSGTALAEAGAEAGEFSTFAAGRSPEGPALAASAELDDADDDPDDDAEVADTGAGDAGPAAEQTGAGGNGADGGEGSAAEHGASEDQNEPADDGTPTEEPTGTAENSSEGAGSDEDPANTQSPESGVEPQEQDEDEFGPLAVPPAHGNSAVITVKVGADRTGNTSVGNLAGVKLRLYHGGSGGPTSPVGEDWAECTSDADGACSFTVPDTQQRDTEQGDCIRWNWLLPWICAEYEEIEVTPLGENHDSRFWVVLEDAPAGWHANLALVTGAANTQQTTDYQFRTGPQLRPGQTYRSGNHFMTGSGNNTRTVSDGTWQLSRNNPALPATCQAGVNVALVLDLSGSVANAGATGDLKNAAIGFTEALHGTGSSLALYTFASTAPRNTGNSGRNWPLTPVDGNVETITSRINDYQAEGGTNWDRGIHQVATSNGNYDLAVVVTDGLPTFYGTSSGLGNPSGPGSFTRFQEVEQAIFSANALKAQGTRMLAVGVGEGISGSPANLAAISGPSGYAPGATVNSADYFQASWQQLTPLLEDLARGATCQAGLTVHKVAEPYGGQPGPGAGWDFEVTRTGGAGQVTPAGTQTTDSSGELGYTVQFDSMTATATLTVAEMMTTDQTGEGWRLDQVACTLNGQDVPVAINDGAITLAGLGVGDDAECTFTNVQHLVPDIDLIKQAWDTAEGPVDPDNPTAPEIDAGDRVPADSVLTWTYTVTNTGPVPLENVVVTDDQDVTVTCPAATLDAGASMTCWGSGPVTALDP